LSYNDMMKEIAPELYNTTGMIYDDQRGGLEMTPEYRQAIETIILRNKKYEYSPSGGWSICPNCGKPNRPHHTCFDSHWDSLYAQDPSLSLPKPVFDYKGSLPRHKRKKMENKIGKTIKNHRTRKDITG